MLHEMATGRRPFERESAAESLTAIIREDAPPLPAHVPHDDKPPSLVYVVEQAKVPDAKLVDDVTLAQLDPLPLPSDPLRIPHQVPFNSLQNSHPVKRPQTLQLGHRFWLVPNLKHLHASVYTNRC